MRPGLLYCFLTLVVCLYADLPAYAKTTELYWQSECPLPLIGTQPTQHLLQWNVDDYEAGRFTVESHFPAVLNTAMAAASATAFEATTNLELSAQLADRSEPLTWQAYQPVTDFEPTSYPRAEGTTGPLPADIIALNLIDQQLQLVFYREDGDVAPNPFDAVTSDCEIIGAPLALVAGSQSETPLRSTLVGVPAELDFGTFTMIFPQQRSFTLDQSGDGLTIRAIAPPNDTGYTDIDVEHDCRQQIPCTVTVTVQGPLVGPFSGSLTIYSTDPEQPVISVPVSGNIAFGPIPEPEPVTLIGTIQFAGAPGSIPVNATGQLTDLLDYSVAGGSISWERTAGTLKSLMANLPTKVAFTLESASRFTWDYDPPAPAQEVWQQSVALHLHRVDVDLFGLAIPLLRGDQCITASPISLALVSEGGPFRGEFKVPALQDCGPLTPIFSILMSGTQAMTLNEVP